MGKCLIIKKEEIKDEEKKMICSYDWATDLPENLCDYTLVVIDMPQDWVVNNIEHLKHIPKFLVIEKNNEYYKSLIGTKETREQYKIKQYLYKHYDNMSLIARVNSYICEHKQSMHRIPQEVYDAFAKDLSTCKRVRRNVNLTYAMIYITNKMHGQSIDDLLDILDISKNNSGPFGMRETDTFFKYDNYTIAASLLDCSEEGFEIVKDKILRMIKGVHLKFAHWSYCFESTVLHNDIDIEQIILSLKEDVLSQKEGSMTSRNEVKVVNLERKLHGR